jgi:hypothetical protein
MTARFKRIFPSALAQDTKDQGDNSGLPDNQSGGVDLVPFKPGKVAQSKLKSTKYVIYTAGNKIIRINLFDPDDGSRATITRPGANNLAVDPVALMMYYTLENDRKIVREPLSFDTPAGKFLRLAQSCLYPVKSWLSGFAFQTAKLETTI